MSFHSNPTTDTDDYLEPFVNDMPQGHSTFCGQVHHSIDQVSQVSENSSIFPESYQPRSERFGTQDDSEYAEIDDNVGYENTTSSRFENFQNADPYAEPYQHMPYRQPEPEYLEINN